MDETSRLRPQTIEHTRTVGVWLCSIGEGKSHLKFKEATKPDKKCE